MEFQMKTLAAIVAVALFASPAFAHRAPPTHPGDSMSAVYSGGKYLGQDPDPTIRIDLMRQGASWNTGGR
jgi:hypothetical protein